MILHGILFSLVMSCFILTVSGQHTDSSKFSNSAQKKWIRTATREMRNFNAGDSTVIILPKVVDYDGFYQISLRFTKPGIIHLNNNGWILFRFNSAHHDQVVGDITLAMDSSRKFYVNFGHVCGGIVRYNAFKPEALGSSGDFFEQFVSDTDTIHWKPLKKGRWIHLSSH